ncbi:MAG: hypothetical protein JSW65_05175, partial [Candidatus Bipolaricaulota bacterium]
MILALDIGTTGLKGALLEEDGTPREVGERSLPLSSDISDPLRHETDAWEWVRRIRDLCTEFGLSSEMKPAAVAVSGNGPTLVPVGHDDRPLRPAMLWMDRRCVDEAAAISEINGFYVDPTFYLPKALWFHSHEPEVYERTRYFFACPEYITYLLTGRAATVLPAVGFESYIWTEELVTQLGMEWSKFPDLVRPGEPMGVTTAVGSDLLGVPEGVPV